MAHETLSAMLEPNTLVGKSLDVEQEPFIDTIYGNIQRNLDQTFLIDATDGRRYTFGDLHQRSSSWAQWLMNRGIGKGDIVSISSENNFDGFSVVVGTWLSGATANPFNFNFTANDTKMMLDCTEPDIIYCSKNLELIEKAAELLDKKPLIVTPKGRHPNFDSDAIFANVINNFKPFNVENSKEHVASVFFTSGTTAIPKGIQISDYSLKVFSKSELLKSASVMITSPLFWISNLALITNSLYKVSTIVIPNQGWSLRDVLQTIQTYKPESWFTGHSLLLDIAQKDYARDYDLSSITCIMTGGNIQLATQRREINEKVFKNKTTIKHLYGSTEVGIVTQWDDDIDIDLDSDEYNSVGTVANGAMLKIMDSSGKQLGPMEPGEIWVKSISMANGYMSLKRKTINPFDASGWYNMGDLGYFDDKKLIYISGRIKDVLKFRGVQISPAEIEDALNKHPDVYDSCVVGKFDPINGDLPVAFVVLRDKSTTTVNNLHEFLKETLAEVKRPHEIRILNEIPKNSVGKHLRKELEKRLN